MDLFKSKIFICAILIASTTFAGCAWLDESDHEKIVGEYEVGWSDMESNRSISKPISSCSGCYEELVSGYVYAVGHNDSFIIAKTHAGRDTSVTYYHIIDIKKNERNGSDNGIYESLNKKEFDSLRIQLKISHIPFDKNYPVNP